MQRRVAPSLCLPEGTPAGAALPTDKSVEWLYRTPGQNEYNHHYLCDTLSVIFWCGKVFLGEIAILQENITPDSVKKGAFLRGNS